MIDNALGAYRWRGEGRLNRQNSRILGKWRINSADLTEGIRGTGVKGESDMVKKSDRGGELLNNLRAGYTGQTGIWQFNPQGCANRIPMFSM